MLKVVTWQVILIVLVIATVSYKYLLMLISMGIQVEISE